VIDSHCHLDFQDYGDDRPAMMDRARTAGVSAMITIGSGRDVGAARAAVALAARHADVYATVGVHPHDVARMSEADWQELAALAVAPRVVGVGETGLDYHYDHSPRDAQQVAFRRFVAMARAAGRPVVSHVRDAHADAVAILQEERAAEVGGVIHCFTGDVADARRYIDLGHYLSFSGIITFKNAEPIRQAAAFAPLDRVLVETDAPYLAPIPYRGKRNEPAYIVKTLEVLAAVRGVPVQALDDATTENTRRLFKLPD
jgi:TatD DNase family protein